LRKINGVFVERDIIRRFGRPQEITTDRGRAFMSRPFMNVMERMFIKYKYTGVGQPQADGMVERVNRTIIHIASTMCGGDGSKWAQYVGEIEYAINTRVSSVTKFSPYELVYGRHPPGPTYTDEVTRGGEAGKELEQIHNLRRRISVLQQVAHENQMEASDKQISYHDAHAKAHRFKSGDTVWWYRQSATEKGVTSKLAYKWKGPFIIAKVIGPVTYILKDKYDNILPGTVHARELYKHPEERK